MLTWNGIVNQLIDSGNESSINIFKINRNGTVAHVDTVEKYPGYLQQLYQRGFDYHFWVRVEFAVLDQGYLLLRTICKEHINKIFKILMTLGRHP